MLTALAARATCRGLAVEGTGPGRHQAGAAPAVPAGPRPHTGRSGLSPDVRRPFGAASPAAAGAFGAASPPPLSGQHAPHSRPQPGHHAPHSRPLAPRATMEASRASGRPDSEEADTQDEAPLEVLLEAPPVRGPARGGLLPGKLAARYGGPLAIPLHAGRSTVIANFVATVDGVVALATGPRGGGSDISGGSGTDRFVMGMLRALADVVVVGAGTLRAAPRHEWTPRGIAPAWAADLAAWRAALGLPTQPTTVVVSARGDVPPEHPGLCLPDVPVVIATTRDGALELARRGVPPGARVEVPSDGSAVSATGLVRLVEALGAGIALCEGGPHLLATLLGGGAIDELFLTIAPRLLGRSPSAPRLGLVEGAAWLPAEAPGAALRSVRQDGSHLFLRYAVETR